MARFVSQGSSVIIVTRLWAGRSEVRFPIGARGFTPLRNVQTSSGAKPAFSWVGTVVTSDIQQPGQEADHPPSSSVKVKNEWKNKSTSPTAFMACTGTVTQCARFCGCHENKLFFSALMNHVCWSRYLLCMLPHMKADYFVHIFKCCDLPNMADDC